MFWAQLNLMEEKHEIGLRPKYRFFLSDGKVLNLRSEKHEVFFIGLRFSASPFLLSVSAEESGYFF